MSSDITDPHFWWYQVFPCAPESDPCYQFYDHCTQTDTSCYSLSDQCTSTDQACLALAESCHSAHQQCYSRWLQIHFGAIVPASLSVICSIYIVTMTIKYHRQFTAMSFAAKLPMFISISDIGFGVFHSADHVHNIITGYVTDGFLCALFGATFILFVNCQTMWECATAYFLNHCVRKEGSLPACGPHNVSLYAVCFGLPFVLYLAGYALDIYGQEGAWCGVPGIAQLLFMLDLWLMLGSLFLVVSYLCTGCILYSRGYDSSYIRKVLKILPWFPAVYFVQWAPYVVWKIARWQQNWTDTMFLVTITNSGGVFNAILFRRLLYNQVKQAEPATTPPRTPNAEHAAQTEYVMLADPEDVDERNRANTPNAPLL